VGSDLPVLPERDIVTQFKTAIDAVASGERPWELSGLRDAINTYALDKDEQEEVKRYLKARTKQLETDILNAELAKALVGAQDDIGSIGGVVRSHGHSRSVKSSVNNVKVHQGTRYDVKVHQGTRYDVKAHQGNDPRINPYGIMGGAHAFGSSVPTEEMLEDMKEQYEKQTAMQEYEKARNAAWKR